MGISRTQLKKRGTTLSGLSGEVTRDANGNIFFNGSAEEIFVNPKAGDFRIKAGSPAIGMGVPVPGVTTDILGRPRDSQHPTIGAFEYEGGSGDGPPIVIQEFPASGGEIEVAPIPTEVVQESQTQQETPSPGSALGLAAGVAVAGFVLAMFLSDD